MKKEITLNLRGLIDFDKELSETEQLNLYQENIKEQINQQIGDLTLEEQNKILFESWFSQLYESFKGIFFKNMKKSMSLLDISKSSDSFYQSLDGVLKFASLVSLEKKRDTIREIKGIILKSLGDAEELIQLNKNGGYNLIKPPTSTQRGEVIEDFFQRLHLSMENRNDPLLVAKKNKPLYKSIISYLKTEEELILIELKNGKNLAYTPLDIKKDDNTPTTTSNNKEDETDKPELKMREIALIYWYDKETKTLTLGNSTEKAKYNGYTSKTSGKSLYNDHFVKVRDKPEERTDNKTSVQYLKNIISKLETDKGKKEAKEDLDKAIEFQKEKDKRKLS